MRNDKDGIDAQRDIESIAERQRVSRKNVAVE
jgi:hypothetical protein